MDSVLAHVHTLHEDVVMGNGACQFQVAVVDVARWIGEGDQAFSDVCWERRAPKQWLALFLCARRRRE
jgi:hypothetical protein